MLINVMLIKKNMYGSLPAEDEDLAPDSSFSSSLFFYSLKFNYYRLNLTTDV